MTHRVEVDVAMRRPPRADATVYVLLSEADFSRREAELLAVELASARAVRMPTKEGQNPRTAAPVMAVGSRYSRSHEDV